MQGDFGKATRGKPNGLVRQTFHQFAQPRVVSDNPAGVVGIGPGIDPPKPRAVGGEVGLFFQLNVGGGFSPHVYEALGCGCCAHGRADAQRCAGLARFGGPLSKRVGICLPLRGKWPIEVGATTLRLGFAMSDNEQTLHRRQGRAKPSTMEELGSLHF